MRAPPDRRGKDADAGEGEAAPSLAAWAGSSIPAGLKVADVEAAAVINLSAVARAIVEAAPRPLFTLVAPRGFRPD
jgi:hypothetical protein